MIVTWPYHVVMHSTWVVSCYQTGAKRGCVCMVTGKAVGIWCSWNSWIIILNPRYCVFMSGYTSLRVGLGYKWSLNGNTVINSNFVKSRPTVCVKSGSDKHWFIGFSEAVDLWHLATIMWDVALLINLQPLNNFNAACSCLSNVFLMAFEINAPAVQHKLQKVHKGTVKEIYMNWVFF